MSAVCALVLLCAGSAEPGQTPSAAPTSASGGVSWEGPPPPDAPAVIARDSAGRATIRAVRLAEPLRLDGRLEEAFYSSVPPMSDFLQVEPKGGEPAVEKTDIWLAFDRTDVYVTFRCWESDPSQRVATEMRRDNSNTWQGNDVAAVLLDTFYDRQNGVLLITNAIGGRNDGQVTNETQYSPDWNPIWSVAVGRFEGGWTAEMKVPFKTLRYRPGAAQVWGFNALRTSRWRNEISLLTPIPAGRGMQSLLQSSRAATVVGLEVPSGSRNLEVKPYVVSQMTSDRTVSPQVSNRFDGDVGVDAKFGVTQGLTGDVTYNTDFAQVEADEQQLNLTRFSLFFPEKREFFLENQGTFSFGGVPTTGNMAGTGDAPILFYSRRIGLENGLPAPIDGGGRLSGRAGRYSLGALHIRSAALAAAPPTGFSVLRVKRDVLRRSAVGVLLTGRSASDSDAGTHATYGLDGTFGFFTNLSVNTYWARTRTPGGGGADTSYRAQLDYAGDRYGVLAERLVVGEHFNPGVGFVRRDDMRQSFAQFRFSPRPRRLPAIRKFSGTGTFRYVENGRGQLESREQNGEFAIEFNNSDKLILGYSGSYEFTPRPFRIAPGVSVPVGEYPFETIRLGFNLGPQRTLSGNMLVERGTFYSGHKTAFTITRGRLNVRPQLSMEPTYSVNRVELVEGSFITHLVGSRATFTITPRMFVSALTQYNSSLDALAFNARLRWEYQPGSELFVVYNEDRDTNARRVSPLRTRALIVKVNRLVRF